MAGLQCGHPFLAARSRLGRLLVLAVFRDHLALRHEEQEDRRGQSESLEVHPGLNLHGAQDDLVQDSKRQKEKRQPPGENHPAFLGQRQHLVHGERQVGPPPHQAETQDTREKQMFLM